MDGMNINIKELCKQIKKSRYVIWTLDNGVHYITNRHWMIKFSELPKEILIQLFSIFAEVAEEGKSLVYQAGFDAEKKPMVDCEKIFVEANKGAEYGKITNFVKVIEPKMNLRVASFGKFMAYLDEEYMKIIYDFNAAQPFCGGSFRPVAFNGNTFVILPYRVENDRTEIELLNELLAG